MRNCLDKRGRKRVTYRFIAKVEVSGYETMELEIHNISMSGVFLKTEKLFPAGTKGRLTIVLECGEDKKEIHSHFVVQRAVAEATEEQPRGIALVLENLDSDSSIILFNIIKYQSGALES